MMFFGVVIPERSVDKMGGITVIPTSKLQGGPRNF